MLRIPHVSAMVVVAASIGAVDIVRLAQQPEILPVQQWVPAPRPDPEIQAGRDWLDRKAQERGGPSSSSSASRPKSGATCGWSGAWMPIGASSATNLDGLDAEKRGSKV